MDLVDHANNVPLCQGSDIWYETQCTVCATDGRNVEAVKHCVECDSNLCTHCLKQHNKFSVMKTHQLLDGGLKTNNSKLPLPNQRCELHAGKLVDVYCGDHDAVCCNTCVTLDHRSCKALLYVPKAAINYDCKQEVGDLEKDADDLVNKLTCVRDLINTRLSKSATELTELNKQVKKMRDDINKHLDDVQQELENELDKIFKVSSGEDEKVLKALESTMSNIDKYKHVKDDCNNASEIFVQVKMGRKVVEEGVRLLQENQTMPIKNAMSLVLDNNIESMLKQKTQLAFVRQKKNTMPAMYHSDFTVKTTSEENIPQISGICQLTEDEILITDASNQKLKKLDRNFQVISSLTLAAKPFSVCKISSHEVAMTMTNSKVQLVLVKEPMVRTLSFRVGDRCRGIAYLDQRLYVCCGGHSPGHPGHVEIFRMNGTHVRSCYEHFERPTNICADSLSKRLFITDSEKGLVMNKECELLALFSNQNKWGQQGLCMIDGGRFCVSYYDDSIVSVFNQDGSFDINVIENPKHISNPLAMYFDENRGILIISMNNKDFLRTFSLV